MINFISPEKAKAAYEELEASSADTLDEIKKKYLRKMRQHHPDKNQGSEEANKKTQEITEAFQLIQDIKNGKIIVGNVPQWQDGPFRFNFDLFDELLKRGGGGPNGGQFAYYKRELMKLGFKIADLDKLTQVKLMQLGDCLPEIKIAINLGFLPSQLINLDINKLKQIALHELSISQLMKKGFTTEQIVNLELKKLNKILSSFYNVSLLIENGMTPSEIIGLPADEFESAMNTGVHNKASTPPAAPIPNISIRSSIVKSALFGISVSLAVLVGLGAELIAAYSGIAATLFIGAVKWRQHYKYNALREYCNKDSSKLENLPQTEKQGFDSGYRSSRSYFTYFGSMLDKNAYSRAYYAGMGAAETKNDAIYEKMKCTR